MKHLLSKRLTILKGVAASLSDEGANLLSEAKTKL